MRARELMTPAPRVVTGDTAVSDAARLMRDLDVGLIPVVDDLAHMHPRGVITDRDIVVRHVAERHPHDCRVDEHMSTGHLDTVGPDEDVSELMARMAGGQVRRILVVEGGRLVGIVAQADLALREGPVEPLRVEAVLERVSEPAVAPV